MRSWFASLLIPFVQSPVALMPGGASLAQDASKLPDYFTQSFDAVKAAPLQVMTPETKPGAAAAAIAQPGETTIVVARPAQPNDVANGTAKDVAAAAKPDDL